MITADVQKRAARLVEILEILKEKAAAEDRDLLLAFASVAFLETPDRVALQLSAEAMAARLSDHFRFVAREIPPPTQLYRGLPGIHVAVRNPEAGGWITKGPSDGLSHEATVIETHTLDTPFIFESLKHYLRRAGLRVYSAIHPVFAVRRQWERIVWIGAPLEEGSKECYCHFVVERIDSKERLRQLGREVFSVLKAVFTGVEDFPDMLRTVRELGPRLRSRKGDAAETESAREFLDWLQADNYIFQGTVKYQVGPDGAAARVLESATGVFTDAAVLPVVFPGVIEDVEANILPRPDDNRIINIDYCHNASAIYHLDPIDDIVIREWDEAGRLREATLLLGRFAKGAFTQKAGEIPLLREKQNKILAQCGGPDRSFTYREIRGIFNRYPARELFYAPAESLREIIERIACMTSDEEIAVQVRPALGYVALTLAFSRLRYSYTAEKEIGDALAQAFGPCSFTTSADLGSVTLLLFYFESSRLERPVVAEEAHRIADSLLTTWEDRAAVALEEAFGEREGRRLLDRYVRSESRSGLYRESTPPTELPEDVRRLEALETRLEVRLIPRGAETVTMKVFSLSNLGLTDTLRTLGNLGLTVTDDLRIPLTLPGGRKGFVFRFEVEAPPPRIKALVDGEERFVDALRALDEERATEDPLNGLVLMAGLTWREVEVLRTLRNHLLQVRTHYNAETVNGVLLRNSEMVRTLMRSFAARFDPGPAADRGAAMAQAEADVRKALESVTSLAEDEVLRALDNLIRSCLRTNFYQRPERPVVTIKIDSRKVEGMPSPRPMFEIYVHSRLIEGIHLRGGKVARGGIRWSDRHDDFRTEVLGLMKTQMVKNSIIVPVGSKGGFVLKGNLPPRPALDVYLIDRYREFVSGLLDVTENIVDGTIMHPPEVVRHDGDDPYLVVAADKGTAHLSDTANGVSAQYGFWLGDAFASGGSAGYDHKKMGITARGAWECVRHHFKNLGHDTQTQPFTVAGIGDMSGDVFGNGVLLSPVIRLQAAFNHLHTFIDPDPDPARSFAERQRLFKLPRSSWRDYDTSLISQGGGIFDRSAKAIPLSPEMRKLLDLEGDAASGEEVVRRILTSGVDLLYNGGIGTYVKAVSEDDSDVGDRANDRVRVDGRELRAKVVGEGGNLGFTQKGRLEFAAAGGLLNTDAVDNSGGVDTSDHEVNIKILLDPLVKKGLIKGREARNQILAAMTDEVAALVLADNANQARAITLDALRSVARYQEFVDLVEDMAGAGILNRSDDTIPGKAELLASLSRDRGFPRPLLAVLLGHTKMWAFEMAMESDFPESGAGRPLLDAYFPRQLREDFAAHFEGHPLKREIIATAGVNYLVNNAGIAFLARVMAASRAGIGELMTSYIEIDREAGAQAVRDRVLAAGWEARAEHQALLEIEEVLEALVSDALAGKQRPAARALDPVRQRLGGYYGDRIEAADDHA